MSGDGPRRREFLGSLVALGVASAGCLGDEEDPVEFSAAPDQEGAVRVGIGDVRADELSVRAVRADRESTIDSPASTNWIVAFPDPDGDELRVVVTVDNVSGVIASTQYPLPDDP